MSLKIIDLAVNADHVHLFFQYPPKYSLSYIAKKIKGRSSRLLRLEFRISGNVMKVTYGLLGAITAQLGRAGMWWRNTFLHRITSLMRKLYRLKNDSKPCILSTGYRVTEDDRVVCIPKNILN